MNRKGCVPSWSREPALQSRGSGHLTPAAPRPWRSWPQRGEGGKKGQGAKRTAEAAGRNEDKGRFVPQKCKGAGWDPPAPLHSCCGGQAGQQPARESRRPPRECGQSQGTRGTRSPCPGLPTPQQHLGGGVGAALPCPHLMLAPFATRKVCLEAQPGRGEEGGRCEGVGEEAVSQLKMKYSPGSSFARVRKSRGGMSAGRTAPMAVCRRPRGRARSGGAHSDRKSVV